MEFTTLLPGAENIKKMNFLVKLLVDPLFMTTIIKGKSKSRSSRSASATRPQRPSDKTVAAVANNPFETRGNKKLRFDVLNRTVKGAERNVLAARSAAHSRRADTLLQEIDALGKSNVFIDRRFGEKDPEMDEETKMLARFKKERMRQLKTSKRSRKYQLDDDDNQEEVLTHFGKALSDLPSLEMDPRVDEYDEDLDQAVTATHFGGGDDEPGWRGKKPVPAWQADGEAVPQKRSYREIMEEVMAKSKAARAAKQQELAEQERTLLRLDANAKEVMELLRKTAKERSKDDLASNVARAVSIGQQSIQSKSGISDGQDTAVEDGSPVDGKKPGVTSSKHMDKVMAKLQKTLEKEAREAAEEANKSAALQGVGTVDDSLDDDYNALLHTLTRQARAAVARDRTKSPEEIAKEEAERLREMEELRLQRMRGSASGAASSGDALDDFGELKNPMDIQNARKLVSGDDLGEKDVDGSTINAGGLTAKQKRRAKGGASVFDLAQELKAKDEEEESKKREMLLSTQIGDRESESEEEYTDVEMDDIEDGESGEIDGEELDEDDEEDEELEMDEDVPSDATVDGDSDVQSDSDVDSNASTVDSADDSSGEEEDELAADLQSDDEYEVDDSMKNDRLTDFTTSQKAIASTILPKYDNLGSAFDAMPYTLSVPKTFSEWHSLVNSYCTPLASLPCNQSSVKEVILEKKRKRTEEIKKDMHYDGFGEESIQAEIEMEAENAMTGSVAAYKAVNELFRRIFAVNSIALDAMNKEPLLLFYRLLVDDVENMGNASMPEAHPILFHTQSSKKSTPKTQSIQVPQWYLQSVSEALFTLSQNHVLQKTISTLWRLKLSDMHDRVSAALASGIDCSPPPPLPASSSLTPATLRANAHWLLGGDLLLLRLLHAILPSTDLRHPIATPTLLLLSQILCQAPVASEADLAAGVLTAASALQFTVPGRRFQPEVVGYLTAVLGAFAGAEAPAIDQGPSSANGSQGEDGTGVTSGFKLPLLRLPPNFLPMTKTKYNVLVSADQDTITVDATSSQPTTAFGTVLLTAAVRGLDEAYKRELPFDEIRKIPLSHVAASSALAASPATPLSVSNFVSTQQTRARNIKASTSTSRDILTLSTLLSTLSLLHAQLQLLVPPAFFNAPEASESGRFPTRQDLLHAAVAPSGAAAKRLSMGARGTGRGAPVLPFSGTNAPISCTPEILDPMIHALATILAKLPELLPKKRTSLVKRTMQFMNRLFSKCVEARDYIQSRRPPMHLQTMQEGQARIRMSTPLVEDPNSRQSAILQSVRKKDGSVDYAAEEEALRREEMRQLKRQLRREERGAMRELRLDRQFITQTLDAKKQEREKEREAKYREVMRDLEQQQANFNQQIGKTKSKNLMEDRSREEKMAANMPWLASVGKKKADRRARKAGGKKESD